MKKNKIIPVYQLVALSILACVMWAIRPTLMNKGINLPFAQATTFELEELPAFSFLIWNLFLAWLPLVFAYLLPQKKLSSGWQWLPVIAILALWLLFFPNSAYIITDFVHLRQRSGVSIFYDLIMLFAFAFAGLYTGIASFQLVFHFLNKNIPDWLAWVFCTFSLLLTGIGIYIGRVLRWNSWDLFSRPFQVLKDILSHFKYIELQPLTFILLLTVFIFITHIHPILQFKNSTK